MNPKSGEAPGPQFEAPQTVEDGAEKQHDMSMEQSAVNEAAMGKQTPKALDSTAVLPLPTDIPAAAPVALPSGQDNEHHDLPDGTAPLASDAHQIEKQWVDRAKKIIAETKDDPKSQKQQMSAVKAEYIRKRFNKTIPTETTDTAAA